MIATLNRQQIDTILQRGTDEDIRRLFLALKHPFYTFEPRLDRREFFDEQSGFVNSNALVSFVVGGNGSGKTYCAAQKCARFVLEKQPPPGPDTPFWVIANTMDQVGLSAWFQKLRTIIPAEAIDLSRITWHNQKRGFPVSVPLHPWKGRPGANWVLEFKSYEQGRMNMQAAGIGGAWFTEQFPWEVFEEVFRGCREFAYPGSIFCDFTPIDPVLSSPVEDLYEKWLSKDPSTKNYAFFRMNTESALRAGHVTRDWYDSFFGLVSDEMQQTRRIGAFASYEGTIFQTFDPRVHVYDHPRDKTGRLDFPRGVWHRRSFDWGSSVDHPFVCLWAYRDAMGRYVFYDEYYSKSQTMTVLDHCERIKARHPWPNESPNYGASYGDPSRPDMIALFNRNGVRVQSANNAVYEGIETVRRLLKSMDSIGGPRILIDRQNCPELVRTMRIYRWKKQTIHGANPQAPRPEPLKFDDDPVDSLRYLVHTDGGLRPEMMLPKTARDTQRRGVGVQLHGERGGRGVVQRTNGRAR
jgi:phage terminase large subunit-like protein